MDLEPLDRGSRDLANSRNLARVQQELCEPVVVRFKLMGYSGTFQSQEKIPLVVLQEATLSLFDKNFEALKVTGGLRLGATRLPPRGRKRSSRNGGLLRRVGLLSVAHEIGPFA
jgi:hypothetical protein